MSVTDHQHGGELHSQTASSATASQGHLITHVSYRDDLPSNWNPQRRGRFSTGDARELEKYWERFYGINQTSIRSQRRLSAPERTAPFSPIFSGHHLKSFRRRFRQDSFEFGRDAVKWSVALLKFLYLICKWPLVVLLATIFTLMLILNIFATVYTITHDSFLDHFCKKELPVLRNMICTSWDVLQEQRHPNVSGGLELDQAFIRYLQIQNEETTLSWALPYWLARWESSIRQFRASIPESALSSQEQQVFRTEFSTYIELSDRSIEGARSFYTHIMGTIDHHLSDTDWLVRMIEERGITSNVTVYVDGPMAQGLSFLNEHYMVYLIGGIEPFRTDISQVTIIEAAQLMDAHVGYLIQRLDVGIDMILSLAASLGDLSTAAEIIETHVSKCTTENNKAVLRLPAKSIWGSFFSETQVEQKVSRYAIDQQRLYLATMRPDIQTIRAFLREAAEEFGAARGSCQSFRERLTAEGRAVAYGWRSEWIIKQAKAITEGSSDLKSNLKNFKLEKMRFDDRLFQRESTDKVHTVDKKAA